MDPKLIAPKHILDAMPIIGPFYTNLINDSIRQGKFSVPKTTRPKRPEEFRPINNMNIL